MSGPQRIVSGGQTGVDRAALDAALAAGVPCGGWCPAGRAAEDGPIPSHYALQETPEALPAQRTAWNVRDSDATLILAPSEPAGGTLFTLRCARALYRPVLCVAPQPHHLGTARIWLLLYQPAVLNVAGPRESEAPGVYAAARAFVLALLRTPGR